KTPGLLAYFRLGETGGTTLVDSAGSNPGFLQGGATLGQPGAIAGDTDTAAAFDGVNGAGVVSLNLASTQKVTVEFWLKWNSYGNDDRLAMEFTRNFNDNDGGFIVDPNDAGGQFAVGIGRGGSRNNVFFARPTAGAWHQYVFVMDTTAPGATQITPYVDGM